jgi:hypothetical protein
MSTTAQVMEQSVAFVLAFARPGTKRVVRKSQVSEKSEGQENAVVVDADKDMVHVGKSIIDSPQLRAIVSKDNSIRQWVRARALPSPLFKAGTMIVPTALVEDVYAFLEKAKAERDGDIAAFLEAYPGLVEEARTKLGPLFDARQYPAASAIKNAFDMRWNIIEFGTPGKLKNISKALYEKEREKAEAEWADATAQIRNALRVAMAELVEHMIDRLSADDDGKAKTFRNSMVENFAEFADLFGKRNLTGDAELAALVEKAQKVMTGVDAKALRSDADIKARVQAGFAEIKANLDTMVVNRPARALSIADEEV